MLVQVRTVSDIGCLTPRGIRSRNIVMVARQNDRCCQHTRGHGAVELLGDGSACVAIGVENAGQTAHCEVVRACFNNPLVVVLKVLDSFAAVPVIQRGCMTASRENGVSITKVNLTIESCSVDTTYSNLCASIEHKT